MAQLFEYAVWLDEKVDKDGTNKVGSVTYTASDINNL